MVIGRRSLLLAGVAVPAAAASARAECVTDTPAVDACLGGVRTTVPYGLTLDLNFQAGPPLDPRITFTRASTATYFDSSGTMQTAATNAPRFDYDPVTHALRGLLIEEARSNLAIFSGDLNNANWSKFNNIAIAPVTTANQATAPDGTVTAASIVYPAVSGAGAYSCQYQGFIGTAAPYTVSIWLRGAVGGEQTYIQLTDNATHYSSPRITLTTQWQRFTVTSPALTAVAWYFIIGTDLRDGAQASTPAQTVLAWGGQVELGAFPTSYIPTTNTGLTRSTDICTAPTSTWFSAAASSLVGDFVVAQSPNPSASLVRDVCALSDASANNRLMLRGQIVSAATAAFGTSIAGTTTASGSLGTTTANVVAKVAATWNGTTGTGSLNGGAVVSYAVGLPAGLTTLTVGNDYAGAVAYLNGWVRRLRYWPRVLSSAELQSVTR